MEDERKFFFEETTVRAFACPDGVVRLVSALNWFWEALAGPIAEHFEASEAEVVDLAWDMAERDPFDCGGAFPVYLLYVVYKLMAEYRVERRIVSNDEHDRLAVMLASIADTYG